MYEERTIQRPANYGYFEKVKSGVAVSEMKAITDENRHLKRMYAEMSMQNDLQKEALGKKL